MYNDQASGLSARLRTLGLAGIIFFTVKGLLWLSVPALVSGWAMEG